LEGEEHKTKPAWYLPTKMHRLQNNLPGGRLANFVLLFVLFGDGFSWINIFAA
jgi:hypothetical protein